MTRLGIALLLPLTALAQNQKLSVSTLVREDLFAGFLANDLATFEKGVQTLARLAQEHPDKKSVLAWQGGAEVFRAVLAHEAKQPEAFRSHYDQAIALCDLAGFADTKDIGVLIVCGASHMIFADRMPPPERARSSQIAAEGYRRTFQVQAAGYKNFPLHIKGELLAGLAQSSQRIGDTAAMRRYLEEVIATMPNTVYASRAQKWVDRPEIAATTTVTCLTCHEPGRLKNRLAAAAQ